MIEGHGALVNLALSKLVAQLSIFPATSRQVILFMCPFILVTMNLEWPQDQAKPSYKRTHACISLSSWQGGRVRGATTLCGPTIATEFVQSVQAEKRSLLNGSSYGDDRWMKLGVKALRPLGPIDLLFLPRSSAALIKVVYRKTLPGPGKIAGGPPDLGYGTASSC